MTTAIIITTVLAILGTISPLLISDDMGENVDF